jgi:hypothetical protein
MQFDPSLISVPFRMQPGLSALPDSAEHLTALDADSPLYLERQGLRAPALHIVPGWNDAPVRHAIGQMARRQGIACPTPTAADFWPALRLCVQEDFAVLDTCSGQVPLLQVCNPTRWAPEEKMGLSFSQIHAPVADGQALQHTAPALLQLLGDGRHWERHVWTLTPHSAYDLHPKRTPDKPWPMDLPTRQWGMHVYLRVERQTFFPVARDGASSGLVIFTIRVMRQCLHEWLSSPRHAQRLRDALASMSPAIQQYKGLQLPMPELLQYLDERLQKWAQ